MPGIELIRLDDTDRKLLRELQKDGRMSNVELARRVGLTPPPTLRRMRNLERAGVIRGYNARIDPVAIGWPISVFVMVTLKGQTSEELRAFEAHVASLPEIRECYMLNGETDFLLKVVARDLPGFQDFLVRQIVGAPHVSGVRTALTVRTSKDEPGVPLED
jgi:DNA-binding Lrp family transcriptional regulator